PGLGDAPVLAELAAEVASGRAEREHRGAGIKVIERLLLDGIDAKARRAAIGGEHHLATDVLAHVAKGPLSLGQPAVAGTELAQDAAVPGVGPVAADIRAL